MIASIIGAGIAAGSAIAGGISSAKKAKESEAILDSQIEDLNYWYDVESSKDFLDSSTAKLTLQSLDKKTDQLEERNNNVAVSQGNTAEANVAMASALNQSYADTLANLSANHYTNQAQLEQNYQKQLNTLLTDKRNIASGNATAASYIGSVGSTIGSGLSLLDDPNYLKNN
ncbi:MAG: hypothetical protein R3Y50_01100 [Rikenellaceae bacterium]